MMIARWRELIRDESGGGLARLTMSICFLGFAVASYSPAFRTNPVLGKIVTDMHTRFPDTLENIRHAMGGE